MREHELRAQKLACHSLAMPSKSPGMAVVAAQRWEVLSPALLGSPSDRAGELELVTYVSAREPLSSDSAGQVRAHLNAWDGRRDLPQPLSDRLPKGTLLRAASKIGGQVSHRLPGKNGPRN